jgi:uncharacterized membrane protein YjjP (DUF1212 family)
LSYFRPRAPIPDSTEPAIAFVLALARALHRYGTPAHRLEEAMRVVCHRLGLDAEVFTTPTAIIMSFGRDVELRTRLLRVDGGELDLGKLARVDALADDVAAHRVAPDDGLHRLEAIVSAPPETGRVASTLSHALTCGAIAVFFGGSALDVTVAGAIGLTLGVLAQVLARSTDQARVFELVGATLAATAANALSPWIAIEPSLVTVAALIVLLPGMSLTVAMTELATRNLMAGTARLMAAVIVLLELAVGVAIGDKVGGALVDIRHVAPDALPWWATWAALGAASLGAATLAQVQRRDLAWVIAACVAGYVGSRYGTAWLGPQLGVLVGAFALGVLSNVFARRLQRPAQIVQVPSVLLLVPGSMGFRGMESLLDRDTLTGVETVFAMFVVALALVAGLLIANAVMSPRRSL